MKNPFKPKRAPLNLPIPKGGPSDDYHAYVIWSGGPDSTVALRHAMQVCRHVTAVSFNYGQENWNEERLAQKWYLENNNFEAKMQGRFKHIVLEIAYEFFPHNPLAGAPPEVRYDTLADVKGSTAAIETPFRNGMFLAAIAPRISDTNGKRIPVVVTGCIEGGATVAHSDVTPRFHKTAGMFLSSALGRTVLVSGPLLRCNKHDVFRYGSFVLGINLSMTRSCIGSEAHHCGRCFPCQLRRRAFYLSDTPDHTPYDAPWDFDDADCVAFRTEGKLPAPQKYNPKWD